MRRGCHARVRDDDVEAAEPVGEVVERVLDGTPVADVAPAPRRPAAGGGSLFEEFGFEEFGFEAEQPDVGAPLVKSSGESGADSPGRAGDQDATSDQILFESA